MFISSEKFRRLKFIGNLNKLNLIKVILMLELEGI